MHLVKRAAQQQGAGLSISDFDRVLDQMYGGQPSYTGKPVSHTTALAVSAVWACISALADDIATLPLLTYRRDGDSRARAPEHYLWDLMLLQSNPELSAWRFFQLMQTWVLLWGNAYAEIEVNGRGQVTALWPWRPDRVKVTREYDGGPLVYTYKMYGGKTFTLPKERIFHLRGLSLDGVVGLSPIDIHRQTIGLSMAITEHGARFFANGARPLGVIQTDQALSDKAYERVKKDWRMEHEGLQNAHRIGILEEGLKWAEAGSDMVDAAYIESQKLTHEDIARIYKVPQHRIGLLDRATNNNVEELSLDYVLYTLSPWAANWQNQIHCDLLSDRENQSVYTAFNFTNLLRGNHETMARFIATMRQWGIMNADEIRFEYLDMDALPGNVGKTYWEPVNMEAAQSPADAKKEQAAQLKKLTAPPAPPAAPPGNDNNDNKKPPQKKPNGLVQ